MTGILISVLAPLVLLAWWAVIVTTARDNEVIPKGALYMIWIGRLGTAWNAQMVAAAKSFAQAVKVAANAFATLKGPIQEMQRWAQIAGLEEGEE